MVEMEIISFALLAAPDTMFHSQTEEAKKNITKWLETINGKDFPTTNWLWFRVMTNLALIKVCGAPKDNSLDAMKADLDLMEQFYLGEGWAASWAAVTVGVLTHSVAGRIRVPPLVVVVPAVVPLLPGLAIYRGLALLADGQSGMLHLAGAGVTAVALASGVILGQYLAQPLKREARRLETRSSTIATTSASPSESGTYMTRYSSASTTPCQTYLSESASA